MYMILFFLFFALQEPGSELSFEITDTILLCVYRRLFPLIVVLR